MRAPASISGNILGFDPRSITGCQLWLDAFDTSAVTGSSPVTAWRDKSGNASNTTSVAGTNVLTQSAINGRQAISLNGSSSFTGSITGSGTTLTVCIVGTQSNTCAINGGLVCFGRAGYLDWNDIGSLSITNFGGIGSGQMCSTRTANSQTVTTGVATPFIYILVFDGTYVNTYYNGALQTTANISLTGTFAYTTYKIGTRAGTTGDVFWTGLIGEVLVYNSGLTTSQRQQVEGYLGWKWGLQTNSSRVLPTTHSSYLARPFSRRFNLVDLTVTPEYWFDAADTNTIATSGNYLTTWSNKGSFTDSNITPTTASTATSGTTRYNGNNLINIPSANRLQYTGYFPNNARARFIVTRQTSAGDVIYSYQGYNSINGYDYVGIATNTINEVAQGNVVTLQSSTISSLNGVVSLITIYNSATSSANNRVALNGSNVTLTTSSGAFAYFTGSVTTYIGNTNAIGQDIGEFLSFNMELTLPQIYQIEGYLAYKWGLQASLPVTHPYYKFPPSLAIPFLPTNLSGCALWLDGADLSSINLSGSNVTQWNDKSGNGRNLPAVSGFSNATVSSAFQNGLSVLNFSGNGLYRTAADSTVYPQDVYVIVALKSLTTHVDVLGMGPTNVDNFNSLTFSEGIQSRWQNGSSSGVRNVFSPTNETSTGFLLIQWSLANNNYLLRRNGTQLVQSSSFTYTLPSGSVLQIGFRHTNLNQANFSGYIGEIIVFNSQLADRERQKVEGYLASKWGLMSSLPTIHPYRNFEPAQESYIPAVAYNNFLWTRFYNITSDPSINGPGSSGWGSLIGTAGAYDPINFQDSDARIGQSDFVGVISKGFMYSATTTVVTFKTNSDDGIVLFFNGVNVLQNWTYHGDTINYSASVTLPAGYTPIELRFFEWGGGFTCELYWSIGSTGTYVSAGSNVMFYNATSQS